MKKWKLGLFVVGLVLGLNAVSPSVAVTAALPEGEEVVPVPPPVSYEEAHVVIYYYRTDGNYTNWNLWLWETGGDGATHDGDFENYVSISEKLWIWQDHPVSEFDETGFNYIIRLGEWVKKSTDLRLNYENFTYDEVNKKYSVYLVDMDTRAYEDPETATRPRITSASFASATTIEVESNYQISSYEIFENDDAVASLSGELLSSKNEDTAMWEAVISLPSEYTIDFNFTYYVRLHFVGETITARRAIALNALYDDPTFIASMTYDGDDLGLTYTATSSTFKLWAPTSSAIKLRIYDSGTPVAIDAVNGDDTKVEYAMVKGEQGVWSLTLNGDLAGKYYTYLVTNSRYNEIETMDPYARAAGINGLRGMILDLDTTDPVGWNEVELPTITPTELSVYELHIADLTSDDTWNGQEANRKKYLGLIEEGTTYSYQGTTVTTGFDHIKELGVNAVQILPFFDQDNNEVNPSFNWGYNPQNYNVLEGVYSADPYDGATRITEMKQVVQAYAAAGIRIIMDVVYNHVSSVGKNPLNITVPEYYFRYTPEGGLSNNSGVGNDTASERKMFNKFMVDSTRYLAEEYKLGGYRFDLMGLHDIDVMNDLATELKSYDDDFIVYGEPWNMVNLDNTYGDNFVPADFRYQEDMPNVGGFNDQMRDGVKGSVFSAKGKGWVQSSTPSVAHLTGVTSGLKGSNPGSTTDPSQVVNYVACHDNNALFDKMILSSLDDGITIDDPLIVRRSVQADSFVMLGQGISFIHAGSEIMRSKPNDDPLTAGTHPFIENSYNASYEVNDIEWNRKVTYLAEFEMYKTMIDMKVNNPLFQYLTREEVDAHVTVTKGEELDLTNATLVYEISDGDQYYKVIFHGAAPRITIDLDGYEVVLDSSGAIEVGSVIDGTARLNANTVLILTNATNGGATSEPTSEPTSLEPSGLSPLAVTGIAVGGSLVVIGLAVLAFFLIKKRP